MSNISITRRGITLSHAIGLQKFKHDYSRRYQLINYNKIIIRYLSDCHGNRVALFSTVMHAILAVYKHRLEF
jgi:hypothetical protein